jgi:hypothetical protein
MLSLDLFNSQFEKKLHEGAVDNTIEHLLKPLSLRAAEIRTQLRAGKLDPKQIDQLEKEYEDLVQRRLDIILDRQPKTEQQQPPHAPAKGLLKGRDLVTPQQRVAAATPPKTSMLGKAKETFSSFANWLAGRDDTGPTYENTLKENDPASAINAAKFAYEQMRRAHDENVDIASIRWIAGGEPITMSRNQIYHTLMKLKGMSRQNRNAFAVQTLADRNNFYLWLGSQKKITPRPQLKQPVDPMQPELGLPKPKIGPVQERDQKKKSNNADNIKAGDVKVARELQKLRAQYPAARSDVEAVARAEIDSSERSQKQLAAIRGANEKQDALLKQLVALDREQGREIDSLDQENNTLEKQLAQIQATNNRLQQTIGQMTGTKRSTRPQTTTPSAPATTAAPVSTADVDVATLKKVQDLESQLVQLQSQPKTAQNQEKISNLNTRLSALQAQVGQLSPAKTSGAPSPFGDLDSTNQKPTAKKSAPRPRAPAADLDIKPKKSAKAKTTKSKTKATKTTPADDEIDFLNIEEPVAEHGGGIGPRQHWQSLMRNEETHDKTGKPMYQAQEKFLVRHNGKEIAFYPDLEQAKQAARDMQRDLKGFATVHRVMREGEMSKIDIMRQDLDLMSDIQFLRAHGIKKEEFKQKYRTLLRPAPQQDVPMEGTAQQFGQAVRMAGYTGRELEQDPETHKEIVRTKQQLDKRKEYMARRDAGYGNEPEDYHDVDENFNMPGTVIPRKSVIQGYTVYYNPETQTVSVTRRGEGEEAAIEQARIGTRNLKSFRVTVDRLIDKIEDQIINEGIRDTASATAVIACLLSGGSLTGCATAPEKTTAQQVLKTGQDIGRTVQTAKNITRAGVEAEVNQEIRNLLRGVSGRPEELNNSNILRIWRRIKGAPPVQPEPQAPEYGPAEPVKRIPQYEAKEIKTKQDYDRAVDGVMNQLGKERDPAVRQMLQLQLKVLQDRGRPHGWHTDKDKVIREDTAALAAEDAILKRIFVRHKDLMMEYGPDKIAQAAESVAYNVGDIAHITDEQINEWVGQVESILGAHS